MPVPGWNDTFTESDDWSHVDFLTMFVRAIEERAAIIGRHQTVGGDADAYGHSAMRPHAGTPIFGSLRAISYAYPGEWFSIAWLQIEVLSLIGLEAGYDWSMYDEAFLRTPYYRTYVPYPGSWYPYPYWVRSHDGGTKRPGAYFDGKEITWPLYLPPGSPYVGPLAEAWAPWDLFAAAGMPLGARFNPGDPVRPIPFKRLTDAGWRYGICQQGDIIGPHLWTELRDLLNKLIWTGHNCYWYLPENPEEGYVNIRHGSSQFYNLIDESDPLYEEQHLTEEECWAKVQGEVIEQYTDPENPNNKYEIDIPTWYRIRQKYNSHPGRFDYYKAEWHTVEAALQLVNVPKERPGTIDLYAKYNPHQEWPHDEPDLGVLHLIHSPITWDHDPPVIGVGNVSTFAPMMISCPVPDLEWSDIAIREDATREGMQSSYYAHAVVRWEFYYDETTAGTPPDVPVP